MSFQLSEKDKIMLELHLPNTFFAFISAFIEKSHNHLLDEFRNDAFLSDYVKERKKFDEKLKAFMYESELVHSWIDLNGYMSGDPKVSAVMAYTEIGRMTATFNETVNKLLEKHFPEKRKLQQSEPANADNNIKTRSKQKKMANIKQESKENTDEAQIPKKEQVKVDTSASIKDTIFNKRTKTEEVLNNVANEEEKVITANNELQDLKKVKGNAPSLVAQYQIEYLRYLHFQRGHQVLINKMKQLKGQLVDKLVNRHDLTDLQKFLETKFYLRPLPEMKMNTMLTEAGYLKETKLLYEYSCAYALGMADLFTDLNEVVAKSVSNEASLFLKDIYALFNGHINKKDFYFVPTKDRKDSRYIERKPTYGSVNTKIQYGVIHEWTDNGEQKLHVIKKGILE